MKLTYLLFTATQIAVALSASPAGRPSPDDGRGTVNATDLAEGGNPLEARACWNGADYGCNRDGYCWRKCGSAGEWCWLAADSGSGPWLKCVDDKQCSPGNTRGSGCGKGDCDACGCSC